MKGELLAWLASAQSHPHTAALAGTQVFLNEPGLFTSPAALRAFIKEVDNLCYRSLMFAEEAERFLRHLLLSCSPHGSEWRHAVVSARGEFRTPRPPESIATLATRITQAGSRRSQIQLVFDSHFPLHHLGQVFTPANGKSYTIDEATLALAEVVETIGDRARVRERVAGEWRRAKGRRRWLLGQWERTLDVHQGDRT